MRLGGNVFVTFYQLYTYKASPLTSILSHNLNQLCCTECVPANTRPPNYARMTGGGTAIVYKKQMKKGNQVAGLISIELPALRT